MKKFLVLALVASLAISSGTAAEPEPTPPESTAPLPISDKPFSEWSIGRTFTHLLRVVPSETPAHLRYAPEYIAQFEVLGGSPVPIPAPDQEVLTALLASSSAFGPLRPDRCKFRPGLSLRSGEGSTQQDLLICFACDEIAVVPAGGEISAIYSFDQPTRDILLNLSKKLLPDDEAIQELPPVRRDKAAPPPPAQPLPEPEDN